MWWLVALASAETVWVQEAPKVGMETLRPQSPVAVSWTPALEGCDEALAAGFEAGSEEAALRLLALPVAVEVRAPEAVDAKRTREASLALMFPPLDSRSEVSEVALATGANRVVYPTGVVINDATARVAQFKVAGSDGKVEGTVRLVSPDLGALNRCRALGEKLAMALLPQISQVAYELDDTDPTHAKAYELFEKGELAAARAVLKDAEASTPDDPRLLFNLGVVTEATGDVELARTYYRRAGRIDSPAWKAAQKRLDELKQLEDLGYTIVSSDTGGIREVHADAGGAVLRVITSPPGAQVFVGAKDFGAAPFEVRGMEAGRVSLTAVLADHAPASQTVDLVDGEFSVVELELASEVGVIEVLARPGSTVTVGREVAQVGASGEVAVEVPVGTYDVVVSAPGRVEWTDTLSVAVNETRRVVAHQGEAPGTLVVRGYPKADIYVDGELVGNHTASVDVLAGNHVVEVRADGFRPYRIEAAVGVEEVVAVDYELEPHLVEVWVSTLSGDPTTVVIDDIEYAIPQGGKEGLRLRPGSVHVQATTRNHGPISGRYDIPAQDTYDLVLAPEPNPGTVLVLSSPLGGDVVVDGKTLGVTPLPIELPAGEATIRLALEGHGDVERVLDVLPGQEHKLNVRLSPVE